MIFLFAQISGYGTPYFWITNFFKTYSHKTLIRIIISLSAAGYTPQQLQQYWTQMQQHQQQQQQQQQQASSQPKAGQTGGKSGTTPSNPASSATSQSGGSQPQQSGTAAGYSTQGYGAAGYGAQGYDACLLYTSPSPRDRTRSRMPSSA